MNCENLGADITPDETAPNATPATPKTDDILGKVSMILGIIALGTQLTGVATSLTLPASAASLICGYITKYYAPDVGKVHPQAKIGIICSLVQIGLSILSVVAAFAFLAVYLLIYFGLIGYIFSSM